MRMSLSGRRPMVERSLFMLYSAITWPSRLNTNLAMCLCPYRVSAEPTQDLVEYLSTSRECIHDVRHDHRDVVPSSVVIGQLDQLLGDRIQISTKGIDGYMNIFVLHHIRKPVRAQDEHLTLAHRHFLDFNVHVRRDAERPCDVALVSGAP